MKNRRIKSLLSMVLCVVLVMSNLVYADIAKAEVPKYTDIAGNKYELQIREWISNGFIKGYPDGSFKPENQITRSEFMALVNRAYGFTDTMDIKYSDINKTQWYYNDAAKATKAGFIQGSNGKLMPLDNISRQEIATIISRLTKNEKAADDAVINKLTDKNNIPSWSKAAISTALKNKFFDGFVDNVFMPTEKITRLEAVVILDRAFKSIYKAVYAAQGVYGPETGNATLDGDVVIISPEVTLKNTTINGNLILRETIGEGNVYLDNVIVKGNTIVKGGGANSIVIKNSTLGNVIVIKEGNTVRIVATGTTTIGTVNIGANTELEEYELTGTGFSDVIVLNNIPKGANVVFEGNFGNVQIDSANINISVQSGTINSLTLDAAAINTNINLGQQAAVKTMTLNAATNVTGAGTIGTANINASGTIMVQRPTTVVTAPSVTAQIAGETVTTPITPVQPSPPPAGGGGGGGGGGVKLRNIEIEFNNSLVVVGYGNHYPDRIKMDPNDAALTYTSSNSTIVTINQTTGEMTGIRAGEATITVEARKSGYKTTTTTFDVTVVAEANKSALKALIAEANNLHEADYTSESWGPFEIALEAAYVVDGNSVASEEEVSSAVATLTSARAALVLKPAPEVKYTLTLTGDGLTSQPAAGEVVKNTTVVVTIAVPTGKQIVTFTVGGEDKKSLIVENKYTFTITANTEVAVTYENIPVVTEVNVEDLNQLKAALANNDITRINLTADINGVAERLVVDRALRISGNGNKISFTDAINTLPYGSRHGILVSADDVIIEDLKVAMTAKSAWQGAYALQAYNAKGVELFNFAGTGADAALLVNASEVKLLGITTVTGNEFGGIEVSKGTALELPNSQLTVTGQLVNATEEYAKPTIWLVKDQGAVVGTAVPATTNITIKTDQIQYYIVAENATETVPKSDTVITKTAELNNGAATFTWSSINGIGSQAGTVSGNYTYYTDGTYLRFQVKDAKDQVAKFAEIFQTFDDGNNATGGMTLQTNVGAITGTINDMDGSNRERADWGVAGLDGFATNLPNGGSYVFYGLIQNATEGTKTVGFAAGDERSINITLTPKTDLASGTYTVIIEALQQGSTDVQGTIIYTFVVEEAPAAELNVKTEAELRAALANERVTEIRLAGSFKLANTVRIEKTVTIDGADFTITGPIAGHGIEILENDVEISNLTVTGSGRSNIHFYVVEGGKLINVTLSNAANAGLIVNGSDVTINGVETANNVWGGINVDQGKNVTAVPRLTVSNVTTHTSPEAGITPAIWLDKPDNNAGWVVAIDMYEEVAGKHPVNNTDQYYFFDKDEYQIVEPVDTEEPVIEEASLVVDNGLIVEFSINETIDLSEEAANVIISYYTRSEDNELIPISNTITGGNLVKNKLWDGYLWGRDTTVNYSKGAVNNAEYYDLIPEGTVLQTLVRKGYHSNGDMDYINIDWTQPATYVVEIKVIDNVGNESVVETLEVTVSGPADPKVANIETFAELKAALASEEVITINIMKDITVTEKLNIVTEKHIDGNGNTLTANSRAGWGSFYVLHFYKTIGSVKDIKITGADAAMYVNGSVIELIGTIDVSGNEFGGIEVSKGSGVETEPVLQINDADLLNSDEANAIPTIWEDQIGSVDSAERVEGYGAMKVDYNQKTISNIQRFYYLSDEFSAPNPVK